MSDSRRGFFFNTCHPDYDQSLAAHLEPPIPVHVQPSPVRTSVYCSTSIDNYAADSNTAICSRRQKGHSYNQFPETGETMCRRVGRRTCVNVITNQRHQKSALYGPTGPSQGRKSSASSRDLQTPVGEGQFAREMFSAARISTCGTSDT
ncbi:hypothetical protein Bbelb_327880 [Branchiostoma belcheri]|nr:hypothetical protein Bbelb_327880 [Branchiostoma belcheri]